MSYDDENSDDISDIQKKRENKNEPRREVLPDELREERLLSLKTKQLMKTKKSIGFMNLYQEP
jgi:hypothetical protein